MKSSYRQAVKDVAQAKRKYHETNKGLEHALLKTEKSFAPMALTFMVCDVFTVCRNTRPDKEFVPSPSCADKERDRARERYTKASMKLFELHNEYVLSLRAAEVYHQQHYSQIHPSLLNALQTLQQEMVLIL